MILKAFGNGGFFGLEGSTLLIPPSREEDLFILRVNNSISLLEEGLREVVKDHYSKSTEYFLPTGKTVPFERVISVFLNSEIDSRLTIYDL